MSYFRENFKNVFIAFMLICYHFFLVVFFFFFLQPKGMIIRVFTGVL